MNLLKLVLVLAVLVLAGFGLFMAFGLIVGIAKLLLFLTVIALAGFGAYKLLSKPDRPEIAALDPAEAELLKTQQLLDEMRRKQLTK
jgi:predicted lipid-binding transport protein (Tim44 family)